MGFHLRRIYERPELQRPAVAAVEPANRTADDANSMASDRLRGNATPSGSNGAAKRTIRRADRSARTIRRRASPVPRTPLTAAQINARDSTCPLPRRAGTTPMSTAFSTFHALETQFQQRFSHGLETLVAFTWEKCLANSNGDFDAENGSEGNPMKYYFTPGFSEGRLRVRHSQSLHRYRHLSVAVRARATLAESRSAFANTRQLADHLYIPGAHGKAYNPTWGGASNICASPTATGCVPVTIAGLAPNSNDPANLSNAGGSITGYSRPSVLPGCQLIPDKQTVRPVVQPRVFRESGVAGGGPWLRFRQRSHRWITVHAVLDQSRRGAGEERSGSPRRNSSSSGPKDITSATTWCWMCRAARLRHPTRTALPVTARPGW